MELECSNLQFRFDHIDVEFVTNVWKVFRLAKSESGNIDILQIKENTMESLFLHWGQGKGKWNSRQNCSMELMQNHPNDCTID